MSDQPVPVAALKAAVEAASFDFDVAARALRADGHVLSSAELRVAYSGLFNQADSGDVDLDDLLADDDDDNVDNKAGSGAGATAVATVHTRADDDEDELPLTMAELHRREEDRLNRNRQRTADRATMFSNVLAGLGGAVSEEHAQTVRLPAPSGGPSSELTRNYEGSLFAERDTRGVSQQPLTAGSEPRIPRRPGPARDEEDEEERLAAAALAAELSSHLPADALLSGLTEAFHRQIRQAETGGLVSSSSPSKHPQQRPHDGETLVLPTQFAVEESPEDKATNELWSALLTTKNNDDNATSGGGAAVDEGLPGSGSGSAGVGGGGGDGELAEVLALLQREAEAVAVGTKQAIKLKTVTPGQPTTAADEPKQRAAGRGQGGRASNSGAADDDDDDEEDVTTSLRAKLKGSRAAAGASTATASVSSARGAASDGASASSSSSSASTSPVKLSAEDVRDSGDAQSDLFDFISKARAVSAAASRGNGGAGGSSSARRGGASAMAEDDDDDAEDEDEDVADDGKDEDESLGENKAQDDNNDNEAEAISTAERVARMTAAELEALDYTNNPNSRGIVGGVGSGRRGARRGRAGQQNENTGSQYYDGDDYDEDEDDDYDDPYGGLGFGQKIPRQSSARQEQEGKDSDDDDDNANDYVDPRLPPLSRGSQADPTSRAGKNHQPSVVATDGASTRILQQGGKGKGAQQPRGPSTTIAALSVRGRGDGGARDGLGADDDDDEEEDEEDTGFSARPQRLADPSQRVFKRVLQEAIEGTAAALQLEAERKREEAGLPVVNSTFVRR